MCDRHLVSHKHALAHTNQSSHYIAAALLFEVSHCIHVNPPSLVRSLRHFGIAENLRPGDENLSHLTVTSRIKKIAVYFWQSIVKTPFRKMCFYAGAQHSKVGEICMWFVGTRDLPYIGPHPDANMKAGRF